MEYGAVENEADYEDFCKFMETEKPTVVNFDPPYAIVNDIKIKIDDNYLFIFEDLHNYIDELRKQPKVKAAKKAVITPPQDFIVKNVVTISGVSFNIY